MTIKKNGLYSRILVALPLFLVALPLWASTNAGVTYQGRLLKPSGAPVESTVQFRIQIRTPDASNCLMYEESQTLNMAGSKGVFALTVNDGLGSVLPGSFTLDRVFANRGTFSFTHPNLDCSGTNVYTPNIADGRKIKVYFNDGSFSGWEELPSLNVNFVPISIESIQVGGFRSEHLLRVQDGSGNPQPATPLLPSDFTELLALINGTSNQYTKAGQLNGAALPSLGGGQAFRADGSGGWQAYTPLTGESDPTVQSFAKSSLPTCSSGEILTSNGTAFSCVPDAGGWSAVDATTTVKGIVNVPASGGLSVASGALSLPDVVSSGTYTKVSVDAKGRVTGGGSLAEADLPTIVSAGKVSGDAITSGTIGGSTALSTTGNVTANQVSTRGLYLSNSQPRTVSILPPASLTDPSGYTLTLPADAGVTGQVLSTNGSGILSWISPATGSVTSVAGTSPIQVLGSTSVTVSVLDAGVAQKGVVTLAADGGTTASTVVQATDTRLSNARTPTGGAGGDLGGTYPNPSVNALRGNAVAAGTLVSGDAGKVYKWTGTEFAASLIRLSDIRSTVGPTYAPVLPMGCAASETFTWDALTDTMVCTQVQAAWAAVTGKPTTLAGYGITDAGTVTGVTAGTGLTGGGSSGSLTLNLADTAVTPGSYTRANLTVDQQGRLTAVSSSGNVNLGSEVTGTLPVANGGTGAANAAAARTNLNAMEAVAPGASGNVLQSNGSAWVSTALTVGGSHFGSQTQNQVFAAPVGSNGVPAFRALASDDIPTLDTAKLTTGTLSVARGGTGVTSAPTNGQILIGNGTGYTLATLTAGAGVTITNNAGSITISASAGVNGLRSCDTGNPNDVMVPVGAWCVDKYEASVWSAADGSGSGYFTDSTTSGDTDPYYPTGAANVPTGCNRNGAGCNQFAVSKPDVIPSRGMTWYQASRFCANSGKVMIPDGVWQLAAIGTNDPGAGTGTGGTAGGSATDAAAAQCNINTPNSTWATWTKANNGVRPTSRAGATSGGTNACVSDFGVEDMVGNLWEWTDLNGAQAGADQAAFTQGKSNTAGGPFGNDGTWNINGSAFGCDGAGASKGTCAWKNNAPAAALRGGDWSYGAAAGVTALVLSHSGSSSHWAVGFRCARPR